MTFTFHAHGAKNIKLQAVYPHTQEDGSENKLIPGAVQIKGESDGGTTFDVTMFGLPKEDVDRMVSAFGAPECVHTAIRTYYPSVWKKEREKLERENATLKDEVNRLKAAGQEYARKLEEALGFTKPLKEIEAERRVTTAEAENIHSLAEQMRQRIADKERATADSENRAAFMQGPNPDGEWR